MEDGCCELPELDLGDIDEWFSQPEADIKTVEGVTMAACQAVELEHAGAAQKLGRHGQQAQTARVERRSSVLDELPASSLELQLGSVFVQHAGRTPVALGNAACGPASASESPGNSTDCAFTAAATLPRKPAAQMPEGEQQAQLQAAGSSAMLCVPCDSPSKQESFSGHNSGGSRFQAAEVGFNSREVGQQSTAGNASGKKRQVMKRGVAEDKKKVTLQLTPMAADTEAAMQAAGLIPSLELVCRTKKELASVLDHLQRRWEASCPGATWPEGHCALRLFPTAAMPILAGASWGRPDLPEALTLMDLCVAMGCPDVLPLHYGWHCFGQRPAAAAQCAQRLQTVHTAAERQMQRQSPQLCARDLPLPSPSTGIGSKQNCLEQNLGFQATPGEAEALQHQSDQTIVDSQCRNLRAARAESRPAEESTLRQAADCAALQCGATSDSLAGSLEEQQSRPAAIQRPPVLQQCAAEQPVASSANKRTPRSKVAAQEVQSSGEARRQLAAAPSPGPGQGGSDASFTSAMQCKTPRQKRTSDGQPPPQTAATWNKDQAKQLTLAVPVPRASKPGKAKGAARALKGQMKRTYQERRQQEVEIGDDCSEQPLKKRKRPGAAVPPTSDASAADRLVWQTPEPPRALQPRSQAPSAGRTEADSKPRKQAATSSSVKRGKRQTLPVPRPLRNGCSTANAAGGASPKRSKRRHGENLAPIASHANPPSSQTSLGRATQSSAQKAAAMPALPGLDLLPRRSRSPDDATCDGFEAWTKFSQQKRSTEPAPTAAISAVPDPAGIAEQDLGSLLRGDVSLSGWTADKDATIDAALALNLEWADEDSLVLSDFPDLPLDLVF